MFLTASVPQMSEGSSILEPVLLYIPVRFEVWIRNFFLFLQVVRTKQQGCVLSFTLLGARIYRSCLQNTLNV